MVLRLAAVEREAEAASTASRLQHSRKVTEIEAVKASLEQRGLALAQNVAAKQVGPHPEVDERLEVWTDDFESDLEQDQE